MTTQVIIARHGNTFAHGQTPTRVGARTDLVLSESGENQALKLGIHLLAQKLVPDIIFSSELKRAIDTARLAALTMGYDGERIALPTFNEIDYGTQENLPEPEVMEQLGTNALRDWDERGIMPDGWSPRPQEITANWAEFLKNCTVSYRDKTIMVVTSNGIARFVLPLMPNGAAFPLKLATGAYGVLTFDDKWVVTHWNIHP